MRERTTAEVTLDLNDDELDVELLVDYSYAPGAPAQTYGPAENCYPAESWDLEVNSIIRTDTGDHIILTSDKQQELEEKLLELAQEEQESSADDEADYRYELSRESRYDD